MGSLFIAMNWLLQGMPTIRRRTNPNYTEYDACYATESHVKRESNADSVALV